MRCLTIQDVNGPTSNSPRIGHTIVRFSQEEEKKGIMEYGLSEDASDQLVELNKAMNEGLLAVTASLSVSRSRLAQAK